MKNEVFELFSAVPFSLLSLLYRNLPDSSKSAFVYSFTGNTTNMLANNVTDLMVETPKHFVNYNRDQSCF